MHKLFLILKLSLTIREKSREILPVAIPVRSKKSSHAAIRRYVGESNPSVARR